MSDLDQLSYIVSTLDDSDRPLIAEHLLRLSHEDRYMRFCGTISDHMIQEYAMKMLSVVDGRAFGIFKIGVDRKLLGLAHVGSIVKYAPRISCEIGLSIDADHRGKQLSKRLMDRVVTYCQAHGVNTMFMSCLRENRRMQAVARSFGLKVVIDAGEAVAELGFFENDQAAAMPREIAYEQISIFDKMYRQNKVVLDMMIGAR